MPRMATTAPPPLQHDKHEMDDLLGAHVQRMLQSPHFARADTQRRLLAYLWEHRHEPLSEYALATEALGRNSTFDSTVDASVRVHISRLRRKIKDYYQQETSEPELLVIPTGTHQLMVVDHLDPIEESKPLRSEAGEVKHWVPQHLVRALFTLCTILAVAVAVLGWKAHSLRQRVVEPPKPNVFWASFLKGSAPIKIILPTPVFFGFSDAPSLRLRSTKVNDFHDMEKDPQLVALAKDLGAPAFEQSYTVTWDTLAAIDMARYLDSVGAKQRVSFDVTRDLSMMVLEQANVIAVGTHQTLQPLHEYLQAMNFSLAANEMRVTNTRPLGGEEPSYEIVHESPERMIRPSIIALLPGRTPGLKLLLLQSRDTAALVSLLSSSAGANSVEEMWRKNGQPEFFEMVVETELESNRAIRSWPVAIHRFASQAPTNSM
jgi:hypothetical protein